MDFVGSNDLTTWSHSFVWDQCIQALLVQQALDSMHTHHNNLLLKSHM